MILKCFLNHPRRDETKFCFILLFSVFDCILSLKMLAMHNLSGDFLLTRMFKFTRPTLLKPLRKNDRYK